MTINDIETLLELLIDQPVTVDYQTINLGNGSPEDQESGTLQGQFNGNSDNAGRTMRYHFDAGNGDHHYLFADEILSIEAAPEVNREA